MLKDYLGALRGTTSTLDKRALCVGLKNEMVYSKLIEYIYSPYISYYIKGRVPNVCNIEEPTPGLYSILDKLKSRELSGHAAQSAVSTFAKTHGDLIYLVLSRSLGSGVSDKILADAGFNIPKFEVQLAKEDLKHTKRKYPLMAQVKYDGVRLLYDTTTKTFYTRSGRSFKSTTMSKWFPSDFPGGLMLDGEIILTSNVQEDRQVISGYINKLLNNNIIVPYAKMCYKVFDILNSKDFYASNITNDYYTDRYTKLVSLLSIHTSPNISIANTTFVNNDTEVDNLFNLVIESGGEGLILKTIHHRYTYKRTLEWEKLKATYSETFKVIGIEEGTGKYEGQIGSLLIENKTLGITSKVGSGLSDYIRSLDPSHFISKNIEVLFNTVTTNDKGEKSLFLPRFKCFRYNYDK